MRLRNIPGADDVIKRHPIAVKESKDYKGKWNTLFENDNPIHVEIGMGKGQFILNLAKRNPDINYIGIERYSSVLLRALEKYDTEEFCELTNVRFICMDAMELPDVFDVEEVGKMLREKLGAKGGGRGTMVQGMVSAMKSKIEEVL